MMLKLIKKIICKIKGHDDRLTIIILPPCHDGLVCLCRRCYKWRELEGFPLTQSDKNFVKFNQ